MDSSIYEYQPSFILGFHGCQKSVGESILSGKERHLKPSEKEWDWLGHGIYFWEGNLTRAWEWAHARQTQGKIDEPFVIGAIIDLRHCLDLFDRAAMQQVTDTYTTLSDAFARTNRTMPKNTGSTPDKAGRQLDCMVMNALHFARKESGQQAYDSVRGPFLEGEPIYNGAGFRSHSHIQICVCTTDCIKGYFRPMSPT